jgi:UDP-N-acetylbacillosamine N-acetyltransferase
MSRGVLCVYGAGGHGLVVAEAAELAGWSVLGWFDDHADATLPLGQRIDPTNIPPSQAQWIVCIGDNLLRSQKCEQLQALGHTLATVIHPTAAVSPRSQIATGVYVGAQASIGPQATVGIGAIVNSAAIVEHHVDIGPYAHIAPGAVLGGAVKVGDYALIGLGARILPVISVGQHATLGAGAVATHDISPHVTSVGVPARRWV